MDIKVILGILLAGVLSNNTALLHFLGTGAVIENERSTRKSLALGLGTTLVMVVCCTSFAFSARWGFPSTAYRRCSPRKTPRALYPFSLTSRRRPFGWSWPTAASAGRAPSGWKTCDFPLTELLFRDIIKRI